MINNNSQPCENIQLESNIKEEEQDPGYAQQTRTTDYQIAENTDNERSDRPTFNHSLMEEPCSYEEKELVKPEVVDAGSMVLQVADGKQDSVETHGVPGSIYPEQKSTDCRESNLGAHDTIHGDSFQLLCLFCYFCQETFKTETELSAHKQTHYEDLSAGQRDANRKLGVKRKAGKKRRSRKRLNKDKITGKFISNKAKELQTVEHLKNDNDDVSSACSIEYIITDANHVTYPQFENNENSQTKPTQNTNQTFESKRGKSLFKGPRAKRKKHFQKDEKTGRFISPKAAIPASTELTQNTNQISESKRGKSLFFKRPRAKRKKHLQTAKFISPEPAATDGQNEGISQKQKIWTCKKCNEGFTLGWALKHHYEHCEMGKTIVQEDKTKRRFGSRRLLSDNLEHVGNSEEQNVWTCKICQQNFTSSEMFNAHKEFICEKNFICVTCRKAFTSYKGLKVHELTCKTFERPIFLCSVCGRHFGSRSGGERHELQCSSRVLLKPKK